MLSDGTVKVGTLLSMISDTLLISVKATDTTNIVKRFHKSLFTRVELPDGTLLDLSRSSWGIEAPDDWSSITPAVKEITSGSIKVTCENTTASVYLDSLFIGTTPVTRESLSSGKHALRVSAAGYETISEFVDITSQQVLERSVVLERSQVWKDSVKAYNDSIKAALDKNHADSIRAVSDTRIASALKSANSIDNLEGMMGTLFSNVSLDTANPKTVAVLPFPVAPGVAPQAGKMASEYAVVDISTRKGIKVVERAEFDKMMQELALSQSGIVPETRTLEAGKILEAQYLIMGNVTEDLGKRLVSVRLVQTETGVVLSAAAASIKVRDMDAFTSDALGEKVNPLSALFRSTLLPGWGQFYTGYPGQGCVSLVCAAGGAGAMVWSIVDWSAKKTEADRYRRVDPSTFIEGETPEEWVVRGNDKIKAQNEAVSKNIIIGASLGGVWVVNMIDALLCGIVESKQVRARYFSIAPSFDNQLVGCTFTLNINRSAGSY